MSRIILRETECWSVDPDNRNRIIWPSLHHTALSRCLYCRLMIDSIDISFWYTDMKFPAICNECRGSTFKRVYILASRPSKIWMYLRSKYWKHLNKLEFAVLGGRWQDGHIEQCTLNLFCPRTPGNTLPPNFVPPKSWYCIIYYT